MGNNIDLIIYEQSNDKVDELDRLYLQLGNNIGKKDEKKYIKELLNHFVKNYYNLNCDTIEDWWKKREQLFLNVDELIWSNPKMFDDSLCKSNFGTEEMKTLTMTSNTRNKILKYLEKLNCIIDDEFSIMGSFNWEEYVGIRLQCYINLIITLRKFQLKLLNYDKSNYLGLNQLLNKTSQFGEEILFLIHRVLNKNFGNLEIYEKINEIFLKQKLNVEYKEKKLNFGLEKDFSNHFPNCTPIPKSLDEIYKKNISSNSDIRILIRCILGFIWSYYKIVLLSNELNKSEIFFKIDNLFPKEIIASSTDKNTMLCLSEVIQSLFLNLIFNSMTSESNEHLYLLEDLIELVLQFGNNILLLVCGNEKLNNYCVTGNKVKNSNRENKNLLMKIFENMFSEDGFFFNIVKTCFIIVSILATGVNHLLAKYGQNDSEACRNFKKNFKKNSYVSNDICIITIIMRMVNKFIHIMQQIWNFYTLLSDEMNYCDLHETIRKESYCHDPMQFHSSPRNTFIVEFYEKHQIGVINELRNKLNRGLKLEVLGKRKYYWKLINLQNVSHIIILFDKNCSTEKNADILEIFGSEKKYKSDKNNENFSYLRSQYTESLFGKLSGPKHLWPREPIIYEGNTLLVVFHTSLESLNQMNDDKSGFRIYFQCHYWDPAIENKINHHISDHQTEFKHKEILLCNLKEVFIFAVAAVVSSLSFMLRGPNINTIEKNFVEILDSLLFAGGLDIDYNNNYEQFSRLSNLKKSVLIPFNTEKKNSITYADLNSHSNKPIDLKDSKYVCSLNNKIAWNKKVNSDIFYKFAPNIDEIEDQIINNFHWGFIVNFVLSFSSIIHYNARKNHMKLSIELINNKTFMKIVRNDLKTARIGNEKLSIVVRAYICCYLHHLGLYYNIFQLCEKLINLGIDLEKIIQLICETHSGKNVEYIHNNFLFELTIKFILEEELCQPLLNVWTLGRKFRSWIIMEKHKAEIHQPKENTIDESTDSIESSFDFLLKSMIYKISLILNLVPFSGSKHPTICLENNYNLNANKEFMHTICSEGICNHFDISGSKYVFYSNKNICLVLESIIGFNKYELFLNKHHNEKPESLVDFESNKDSFKDIKSSIFDDVELEKSNIHQIIKDICDGIDNLIKSPNYFSNTKYNEIDESFIWMNIVFNIRRFRAISRFEAFRILSTLLSDKNINEFLLTSLIKSIRSMGKETPYLFPLNSIHETEILRSYMPNHFYFPNEYYKKGKNNTLEVHYSDHLVGCGKKIQKQVKDAYYKLLYSLINGKVTTSKGAEILKISLFAYFKLKKTESYDFLKTYFPTKILNLMTGCNKSCELGNECIPSVSIGPYPIFLVYSIICLKCSLLENSTIKLSLIFSSFVGLSHSISISSEFKGQLTVRELWRICEIYFMGNILILTSKMTNFLKKIEISRTEQKIYLENMKYIFNRRKNVNSSIRFCELVDDLFIEFFYIKPSILSNIICRALDSSNQVLHFYCIKFLWKFLPIISTKDFLEQYSNRLIPDQYLFKAEIVEKLNYIDCFESYLEKIGQSLVLFDSFEEESKINPPALLINSSEIGPIDSFNNKLGSLFDNTNRLINNSDDFYKNIILLLRLIVLYSEKNEQINSEVNFKKRNPELIHSGFVQLLCEQIYKIPSLLDSLLNLSEYIKWEEVYKCIGMLAVIIDEYDCETYIGKLVRFQENPLIGNNKITKVGIIISNDPLKKEYSILINDFKSIEVKKFSYNSINILNKSNISFPVKFMISKLNFDVIKILTRILKISFLHLSSLSANVENLEKYFSIKITEHAAIISNFEKKKLVGLQIISMSLSFINILLNNEYISTLNLSNDRNVDQLIELLNTLFKVGIVNLPSINEKSNEISSTISIILSRRFIQRTLRKDQFANSSYYPIFKKYTQADLLNNSPYANIMLTLPTKWEVKNQCLYSKNESTIIYNIDCHLSQDLEKSVMFTADCRIPTLLCFYYFEVNFSYSIELQTHNEFKQNFSFLNEFDLPFYISIGLYRDGCQKGISGSFGSYAYKSTGKLIHSCDEKEFIECNVENFSIGDTVGCGVDFLNKVAFFTKNGRIIRFKSSDYTIMQESLCQNKNDYPKFNSVMGHFKPAIWIEKSNYTFDTNKYLIVNANFGQELFKYKYINKLGSNNILSLENEELSIFRDNYGKFASENFGCNNCTELNETELNRRTLAFELHEIISNSNFPLSVCIHALESCGDNLELAANWLLEHKFQNSSSGSILNQSDSYTDSINGEKEIFFDGNECANSTIYSEKECLIDRLVGLRNNTTKNNSGKYFELINVLIFNKYNRELYSNKDKHFDISRYFLIFGSFGENPLYRIENYILNNYPQNENIQCSFSSDIWFNSQYDFQGYERKNLSEVVEHKISNLSLQLFRKRHPFSEKAPQHQTKQNFFSPGTIVEIAPNIKYWMIGVAGKDYASENILIKNIGAIIDLNNSPKCRIIYFLKRLSKLTGVVWLCDQVTNSTLVQFFDYYSLVYYLVNLPSNFLIGKTNIRLSDSWMTDSSGINDKTFQGYIENIFSYGVHDKNGRTSFCGKLPQIFHLYFKSELFKCIKSSRNTISKNLNQFQEYLFTQSNHERLSSLQNILQIFKLVFGSKSPKISDYFVPMYTKEKKFSIYYTNLINEEYMIGYIKFLDEFSKKVPTRFTDIILKEYISTIKTSIYSEIPIIKIETSHPCECMIDKKYDISFKDCDYFFAIFDPLCEINFDNLSFLKITLSDFLDGRTITLLKRTGKGLSGCKLVIPANLFSIHLVTSSQNKNKYGIKAYFIPIRYSISDFKFLENKNIHFSYLLLDLIFKNIGNNIDLVHIKGIVEILLSILFEIHIPNYIYKDKQISKKYISSFDSKNEKVTPIQNSFIHIVQQLINIFIKHPEVICYISQKSIVILDYLNTFSNIVYSIQMDQLQIVTNHGRNVNIKYCIMTQLHYLLFFYKNHGMDFSENKKYPQKSNFTNLLNIPCSKLSLELQIQHNLIAELNLAVHDSNIKYYYKNNVISNISNREIHSTKKLIKNHKESISTFLLNKDIKTHNLLISGKKSIFNFCKWYNIISTSNISIPAFISSITYIYSQKFKTYNKNSIENLYLNTGCTGHLLELEGRKNYSYYYEPNTPLVLIEKLGEVKISIISAVIIIPSDRMSSSHSNLSIDISQFIRETLEFMDNKLLLLPKNRLLWLNNQTFKSHLSKFDLPMKMLNNPILINYSLRRVLTDEVIALKNITFTYNDLVVLTTSTTDDAQDRVKLLWDLLIHLKNKVNSKLVPKNLIPWMEGWEDKFISSNLKEKDNSFDPRVYTEYLNIYLFPAFKKENMANSSKMHNKKTNYNSLLESLPIQLMREFLVKSYSESIFQRKYWPVFIGTIPIRDFELANHYFSYLLDYGERHSENRLICGSPSLVSNLREMNAPCSISFWLFPINLDKYQHTFSISNNKKFEIYRNKINMDYEDCDLSENKISEYYNRDGKWKLIAYRGVTVSTISFWITEMGNLGIIVNSPNKNYPSSLMLNKNAIDQYSQAVGDLSFSSFIQNKSSAIEFQTTIIISNRKINFDQWNHIAVTIGSSKKTEYFYNSRLDDSYNIKLYINGLLDECKNIPTGNLPLIGGDLPWIIGYPEYLRTDCLNNNIFQSVESDSLINEIPNIFLGQDIGSSKLLKYLGQNSNYLNLVTGEPLFGLLANFIVIHFEWEIENIHDYIKKTFDEILYQDELDEINRSEDSLSDNSNQKSPRICSYLKSRDFSKYSKTLLHVFSNNWKNKPIVSHFNNIWQQEYINIKIKSDKEVKIEERNGEKELLIISIPKILMHNNINSRKIHVKLDIIALEKLEIINYEELAKDDNRKTKISPDLCSCKDSPIDTVIMVGKNGYEDSVFILRLKYLNNIFSDFALTKLKKELDIIFEKEAKTSNCDSYSNSANQNLNILHDTYSDHDIIKKFENYCNFDSKNTNKFIQKASKTEYVEDKQNLKLKELKNIHFNVISSEEMHEIISSVSDYINFLFNEIKFPEPIFPMSNSLKLPLFEEKVGCQNCKVVVLNYLNICNTILKRISMLFVSIFNFIEIVSPRPSIFKYSWLKMIRRYLSLSLKEVLINLCLTITEDSKADGKIRVTINRTKPMLINKEIQYLDDQSILNSVTGQLYVILEKVPIYRLRCKKRPWYVIYEGEGGIDAGGIYRDLLSHICLEIQSDKLPLFVLCQNSYGCGENQFYFVPNPTLGKKFILDDNFKIEKNANTDLNDINSENKIRCKNSIGCKKLIYDSLYKFIGKLMGISIRTQIPLNLDIPKIIWKLILGENTSLNDLKQIDLYSVKFYEKLKEIECDWENNKIENKFKEKLILEEFYSLQLNWSCLNINGEVVELKLGGEKLPVAIDELGKYCSMFKEYKLEREFLHATNNIRKGITEIIPENILELQTHEELERLICGNPSIDIELLKQHTKYTGYTSNDKIINWFWDVISEMSVLQQQMFLRFVWGRSRLPSKGAKWECDMEIVRAYAYENTIYGGYTNFVENNHVSELNVSENTDRTPSNSNLYSEEFDNIRLELERDNDNQLNAEINGQTYFSEQSTLNIASRSIAFYGKKEDHLLPTSHTCFFQLELPAYSSKEILKEKLIYAITEGIAIDIDNVATDTNWE
ncbi:HECT domain-containing family [Cryptosporidium sp. chipmunk genotype I]|uniref:HECT domain-containing family n=1 Tax=Cryptosporidium sp. chipmunk genotype I TaxID=1280935 RepID=UPI00351A2D13|nr:HECT domain-containing family [Cryptosporidium sp. chipmunk genotype I]